MGGGIVLSLGNLATQYAWAYVGLSVTEIISSSMCVVIGTIVYDVLLYQQTVFSISKLALKAHQFCK
jgi:Ureide permease